MRRYLVKIHGLAFSETAKDTYILFVGNIGSAFFGFLFTLFIARALSIEDFGVFSAATNFIFILASFTDLGISSGLVKFISGFEKIKESELEARYIKAGLVVKIITTCFAALAVFIFARFFAEHLFATADLTVSIWVIIISFSMIIPSYFSFVFQGQKRFLSSALFDNVYGLSRVILVLLSGLSGYTLYKVFGSFALAFLPSLIFTLFALGSRFIFAKTKTEDYRTLLKFSGWLGVNKIVSAFSGRLDVTMLATLAGATAVGFYSVPSKLAMFIALFVGSYSSVLAPRLSAFNNQENEKTYIIKSTLALVPVTLGVVASILFAHPFIVVLFGAKFVPAVNVFRALAVAYIPFVFTAPAVAAIIYAIKKPIHIGIFSFFQIGLLFILNLLLIPKLGEYGPTVSIGVTNIILTTYMWFVVIKHYSKKSLV